VIFLLAQLTPYLLLRAAIGGFLIGLAFWLERNWRIEE
jgi:hypothetical protein